MKARRMTMSLALIALICFPLLGNASIDVRDSFPAQRDDLPLRGAGTATWMRVVNVYDAALFAPVNAGSRQLLSDDVPVKLELAYHTRVTAAQIIKAAEVVLERQHGPGVLDTYRDQIRQLHASYRDVSRGDRYRLELKPGQGVHLYMNDELLITLEDEAFGRLYLGIWLGEDPLSDNLRTALLEGTPGQ